MIRQTAAVLMLAFFMSSSAYAQEVGLLDGHVADNLDVPVWDGFQDLVEIQDDTAYSIDLDDFCSVETPAGVTRAGTRTYSIVSGSVAGLSLVDSTYSGTVTTPGISNVVFRCTFNGTTQKDVTATIEVLAVPVSDPVLAQPVVVAHDEIHVALQQVWDSANTPITYSLERSTTSATAGFSEIANGTTIFDGDTGYENTGLTAETQYWYRTQGTDTTLATSNVSDVVTATTGTDPGAGSPPGGNADANIAVATVTDTAFNTITWDSVATATSYRFLVRVADGAGSVLSGPSNLFLSTTTDTNSLASVTGLASSQQYGIRTIPGNAFGEGTISNWEYFTTTGSGSSCEILFGPWDYSSEPVGVAQNISGIWSRSTNPSSPTGNTTWEIVSSASNPLFPGEKYFRSTCDKADGCTRTERTLGAGGDPFRTLPVVSVGGDDFEGAHVVWYGVFMRIDEATTGSAGQTVGGPRGFLFQWHSPNVVGNSSSPHHGIRGRGTGVAVYRKERANNAASGDYENIYSANVLSWPAMRGETHLYLFKVDWDGRSTAEGSDGIFEFYLDDNPTPLYSFNNDRNVTYGLAEGSNGGTTPHPYAKHGLYIVDNITGIYQQSYSRFTMGGANCSRADMVSAMGYSDLP